MRSEACSRCVNPLFSHHPSAIMKALSTKNILSLTSMSCRIAGIWPIKSDGSPYTRITWWSLFLHLAILLFGLVIIIFDWLNKKTKIDHRSLSRYNLISNILFSCLLTVRTYSILVKRDRLAHMHRRFFEWHKTALECTASGTMNHKTIM